jgi:dTDP-4-amino-4,6-dideoxygalactose transaminase
MNARPSEMQSAILRALLPHLVRENAERQAFAAQYGRALSDLARRGHLVLPMADKGHAYHQFAVEVVERDRVARLMHETGVATKVHYAQGLYRHPGLSTARSRFRSGAFPITERLCRCLLSLPIQPELSSYKDRVVAALRHALSMAHAKQCT